VLKQVETSIASGDPADRYQIFFRKLGVTESKAQAVHDLHCDGLTVQDLIRFVEEFRRKYKLDTDRHDGHLFVIKIKSKTGKHDFDIKLPTNLDFIDIVSMLEKPQVLPSGPVQYPNHKYTIYVSPQQSNGVLDRWSGPTNSPGISNFPIGDYADLHSITNLIQNWQQNPSDNVRYTIKFTPGNLGSLSTYPLHQFQQPYTPQRITFQTQSPQITFPASPPKFQLPYPSQKITNPSINFGYPYQINNAYPPSHNLNSWSSYVQSRSSFTPIVGRDNLPIVSKPNTIVTGSRTTGDYTIPLNLVQSLISGMNGYRPPSIKTEYQPSFSIYPGSSPTVPNWAALLKAISMLRPMTSGGYTSSTGYLPMMSITPEKTSQTIPKQDDWLKLVSLLGSMAGDGTSSSTGYLSRENPADTRYNWLSTLSNIFGSMYGGSPSSFSSGSNPLISMLYQGNWPTDSQGWLNFISSLFAYKNGGASLNGRYPGPLDDFKAAEENHFFTVVQNKEGKYQLRDNSKPH